MQRKSRPFEFIRACKCKYLPANHHHFLNLTLQNPAHPTIHTIIALQILVPVFCTFSFVLKPKYSRDEFDSVLYFCSFFVLRSSMSREDKSHNSICTRVPTHCNHVTAKTWAPQGRKRRSCTAIYRETYGAVGIEIHNPLRKGCGAVVAGHHSKSEFPERVSPLIRI